MVEERIVKTRAPGEPVATSTHTTVIERRGGGGGLLIGLAVLLLVAVAAFFLFNQSQNDNAKTNAVTSAAKSVGDTADKAGAAIEKSVE
ncbi:hypothetical protein M0208_17430 [Sphingomonas sp. SUN019]|uniref:hypothetical protein n=1 Tax=Sphingomonas sp. SUN019 TaxID=2937788 RepID=UPI002164198A|nr:hypothetical protein [Sphingomonas sp. SUN019]UVO52205.1 hypothetical protein M0208_17430 [Sphingomonas sp. SUN019]